MAAEYGSGIGQTIFDSTYVSLINGVGEFTNNVTLNLRLHLLNEAGLNLASNVVTVSVLSTQAISISFPEANRTEATGYKYAIITNSISGQLTDAYQIGMWRMFQTDSDSFSVCEPILLYLNDHIQTPPSSVATPLDLPTGEASIPGQVRLVIGGNQSNSSSYYVRNPWLVTDPNSLFFRHDYDNEEVIAPVSGEYWTKFGNPLIGIFPLNNDIYGTFGCSQSVLSVDTELLERNLLFGINYAAPDNTETSVTSKGTIFYFSSNTGEDIKSGSLFGLNVAIDGFNFTSLMNRRILIRFLGFYDPVTGVLDTSSGLDDGASMNGIDADLYQSNKETGFLSISKTLPGSQKAVFKIYPKFKNSEIYPPLTENTQITAIPVLLPSSGVRVPLAAAFEPSQGGYVSHQLDRGRVVPGSDGVWVLPGLFIVRGFESSAQPRQNIIEFQAGSANQQVTISQDGRATMRGIVGFQTIVQSEALLALVDFTTGDSVVSDWSNTVTLTSSGGLRINLYYPVNELGFGVVRQNYPEIGGNTKAYFNPPNLRIYIKKGTTVYRLNALQSITQGVDTQTIDITSLSNAVVVVDFNTTPSIDFCCFDPPELDCTNISGGLDAATYQVAVAYAYNSGLQVTRIRQTPEDGCIPAIVDPLLDNLTYMRSWGPPIIPTIGQTLNQAIRSVIRKKTTPFITRRIDGGAKIFFDPLSEEVDNGLTIWKPDWIPNNEAGRWLSLIHI